MKDVNYKVITPILNYEQYGELEKKVLLRVKKEMLSANKAGQLDKYLRLIRCDDLLKPYNTIYTKQAKVCVIGRSTISIDVMTGIAKDLGMDPDRFEFLIDYKKLPNINIGFLRNNTNYSDVIWGPTPHSMEGKEGYSSALGMILDNSAEFPKLIVARDSRCFKINRKTFEQALRQTQYYQKEILSERQL